MRDMRIPHYNRLAACQMTAVGFEPTRIAPPELESGALDRSAKLSLRVAYEIADSDGQNVQLYHADPQIL